MVVTAARPKGICSAGIQKGDKLIIVSPGADLSRTDHLCMYAISVSCPSFADSRSIPFRKRPAPWWVVYTRDLSIEEAGVPFEIIRKRMAHPNEVHDRKNSA